MIFPDPIQKGEYAGLIAPASPVSETELQLCIDGLRDLGYGVILGNTLSKGSNIRGYLAGTAKERAADLNDMFENPKVRAIFCVRGGYGSSQILEYLDYAKIRKFPKAILGYSDITSIHTVLQNFCCLVTFHGPMARPNIINGLDAYSYESMMAAFSMKTALEFENPLGEDMRCLHPGKAEGLVTGGNLAVLARSCGTPFQPDLRGKLLFLEDVGESIPRIDMYLTQIKLTGLFQKVKGILLGGFLEDEKELDTDDFFREWFAEYEIPILSHIRSDHRMPMGTLPFGTWGIMDAKEGWLVFLRERGSRYERKRPPHLN